MPLGIVFIFALMANLIFIIWNGSPEIFTIPLPFLDSNLTLRWYGLLFAAGFLISQQILYYIHKKEGKPEKDVDTLTVTMVIATIIGARLGHVFFYEPDRYLANPIDILKVWEGGLASHGAAIAILIALYLYARSRVKKGQKAGLTNKATTTRTYFQVVDRIVILVALTGALIRFGNFFNSEIIGNPTRSDNGVVFARSVTESLEDERYVEDINYVKVDSVSEQQSPGRPVKVLVDFKTGAPENELHQFMRDHISTLRLNPYYREAIDQSAGIDYRIADDETGRYSGIITMNMVPRYPTQLYESLSYLLLFIWLYWIWSRQQINLPAGRLLGIFLIVCFGMRFILEFLKENQVAFEEQLPLNMGQLLSIPLVLAGILILMWSYRQKAQTPGP